MKFALDNQDMNLPIMFGYGAMPIIGWTADSWSVGGGKQYYASAQADLISGTTLHSVSSPFTISITPPTKLKTLSYQTSNLGFTGRVPRNNWTIVTRKGVVVLANTPPQVGIIRTTLEIPAGAETNDLKNVRAMIAAHAAALYQYAEDLAQIAEVGSHT